MSMTDLFIKPARDGLIVRDPQTRTPLAAAGESKPRTSYWLRRLAEGDVVETKPASATKTAAKAQEK